MEDKEAVEKTLEGDREAFGVLVSRYQSVVYGVALARVYDHQDAQDLSQEAFLRAYMRLPMLKKRDAFGPWLFMILRRLCVDFVRGKWRTFHGEQAIRAAKAQTDASINPQQRVAARDSAETLWTHVSRLDDRSREILCLHYGQELKVSEIAAVTGLKESTVKMRLQKARARLGTRVSTLKEVWGIAPFPALSAGVMKDITALGAVKGGLTAASPLFGGLLAGFAMLWWSGAQDIKRWKGHTPAGMMEQGRRTFARSVVLFAAALLAAPLIAGFAAVVSTAVLGDFSKVSVPAFVKMAIPFAVGLFMMIIFIALGATFKREIDLISPRDKVKQLASAGSILLMFAAMISLPAHTLIVFGTVLMLQYFFVNKSVVAGGAVLPGFWVAPLLRRSISSEPTPTSVTKKQINCWLTTLHEYGLVAPPRKSDDSSTAVRLRLRASLLEKMEWRAFSSLHATTEGLVSCTVAPRDYVALVQHFGLDELPRRQELAVSLGNAFTDALHAWVKTGDKAAVVDSLGLSQCPLDTTKTYRFVLMKYLLPLIGIGLILFSIFRHFA